MHKLLVILLFVPAYISVASAQAKKKNVPKATVKVKEEPKVVVKDSSKYSKKFLEELNNFSGYNFILQDSILLVKNSEGKTDTASFPIDLPIHKSQFMVGNRHDTAFVFEVKRINYSCISYNLHLSQNRAPHNEYYLDAGEADLNAIFFKEKGTIKDEKGMMVKADVYIKENKDCNLIIRLGRNDKGAFITTIETSCKNKSQNFASPVLVVKK